MEQKEIKYTIDKGLYKKFKKIVKDNKLNKDLVLHELINEYVIKNEPISEINLDKILDKIVNFGLSSLTKEEKDFLDKS